MEAIFIKYLNIQHLWFVTKGKWYTILLETDDSYQIINDSGYKDWFPKEWFKPKSEFRNDKLKEIGI